jgi:hypothetical protein
LNVGVVNGYYLSFSIIPYIAPTLVSNIGLQPRRYLFDLPYWWALTIFSAPLWENDLRTERNHVFRNVCVAIHDSIWLITNLIPTPLRGAPDIQCCLRNDRIDTTTGDGSSVVTPQQQGGFMAINSSVQWLSDCGIGGAIIIQEESGWHITTG